MTGISAGWYPDPSAQNTDGFGQRYWDGNGWTEHVHHPAYQAPTYQAPAYQAPTYPANTYATTSPTTPDGQPLAGWWMRVLAQLIDVFIQLPLIALALFPIVASQWDQLSDWFNRINDAEQSGTFDANTFGDLPDIFNPFTGPGFAVVVAIAAVNVLYSLIFLGWKQATPGKLVLGLRVRLRESPGLPWSAILVRVGFVLGLNVLTRIPLAGLLFSIAALLDVLWPLWDPNKQALHDKLAATNVVLRK